MTDPNQAAAVARDAGLTTPQVVLDAFVRENHPRRIGPLELQPMSIGMLWTLQAIDSPFVRDTPAGSKGHPVQIGDICQALYILTQPEAAHEALGRGKQAFDIAAHAMANQISGAGLGEFIAAIQAQVKISDPTAEIGAKKKPHRATSPRKTTA